MSENEQISELLKRYLRGECTDAEREIIDKWYDSFDSSPDSLMSPNDIQEDLRSVQERIGFGAPRKRRRWLPYAAAAALAVAVSVVVKLALPTLTATEGTAATAIAAKDILPGSDRPTLTLSDGRVIALDEAAVGSLPDALGTYVVENEEENLQYPPLETTAAQTLEAKYHTLSTPKGRQFKLTLPDGSKVWLNSVSSMTYDVSRFNHERVVRLTGEAYFEVTSTAHKQPFKVITDKQTVTVLGTKFNINCYPDESGTRTTLVEGVVNVAANDLSDAVKLVSGQEAFVDSSGRPRVQPANTEAATAWINGLFYFDGNTIDEVMRQLVRWYDVEIIFQGDRPPTKLWGEVNRNATAETPMKLLAFFNFNHQVSQVDGKTRITIFNH